MRSNIAEVRLVAPMPIDRCLALLNAELSLKPSSLGDTSALVGRIDGNMLQARRRIQHRNSFQTWIFAEMTERGERTYMRCRFSTHPSVRTFTRVWFSGVILLGLLSIITSFSEMVSDTTGVANGTSSPFLIFAIMLAGGGGVIWWGRHLARNDQEYLLAFISQTILAEP